MRENGLAYAQVRLQARFAERPTGADWQMIETGRDFTQCLDAAKRTSLSPFVTRLSRESDGPAVEQGMRDAWAELVGEVASWVPDKWRPSLLWLKPLPYLRLGDQAWPPGSLTKEERALLSGDADAIARRWRTGLSQRLPSNAGVINDALAPFWDRFTVGPPRQGDEVIALVTKLETVFRRQAQTPVAVFAWLGLAALAVERLRGALLLAVLFASKETARST